jgi:hypothetical protein
VAALEWQGSQLRTRWERSFQGLDLELPVRAALSSSGRLLAILGVEDQTGLWVLETAEGRTAERLNGPALDVAFDRLDRLLLLVRGELRRLE